MENGLCPTCLEDFRLAEKVKAKHSPHWVDMTLEGIAKAASEVPTSMADAFHDAAAKAIVSGSEYGWPRK